MSDDTAENENAEGGETEVNTISEINDENIEKTKEDTSVMIKKEFNKEGQSLKENIDTFDFEPFLYSFETSPFAHSSSTIITTLLDDRLHQDHAFGIIWLLFSKQEKCPNILQLHWSLQFLEKLKNIDGTYPGDVNKCIQMIQDNLIKQYAKLGTKLETVLKYINESIEENKRIILASTPKVKRIQETSNINMTKKSIGFADKDFLESSEIISFTYNEMISRGPLPCIDQTNPNYSLLLETYTSLDSIKRFMKNLNLSEESIANMNKEELLQFFNKIRKEYVETVKKQIDKICSLENFMQGIDKESFKAYITDDLMQSLNKLGDSDTEDSTGKIIV